MTYEALTLPGVDVGTWTVRDRYDAAAAALADRHYVRRRPSPQVGGLGKILVLVTPDERALWLSRVNRRPMLDGLEAIRCAIFRNESPALSSDLIVAAMETTEELWPDERPRDGWVTFVDRHRVRGPHPGYCFKQAGWRLDRSYVPGYRQRYLVRLRSDFRT